MRVRLPAPRTSLVGRDDQIPPLLAAVHDGRLVTLTGPGGCGKTRLAVAVALRAQTVAPDGVCWVDLGGLPVAAQVAEAIAAALGVAVQPAADIERHIVGRIGDGAPLLVLDNCEHVLAASAQTVDRLLAECPRLRILATSREPLGVPGEVVRRVPPLDVPPAGCDANQAMAYASIRLLAERAQAARPGFRLDEGDVAAAGWICRWVDGLPLGIELAAARLRILTLGQVVAGLDNVFELLTGGVRTGPARQHSMRATLDWSYDLLSEAERGMLRRLAVFTGSFGLDAARAVWRAAQHRPTAETLDLLTSLVDKSLVLVSLTGAEARYRLPEVVREYGLALLVGAGEAARVAEARAGHRRTLAERDEPLLTGTGQAPPPDTLDSGPETRARDATVDLRICALGAATVHRGGRALRPSDWGYAKPRELLYLLASSPPQSKEQMGEKLWPDLPARQLRNALHTALRELRRALGDPGWIVFRGGTYGVDHRLAYAYDVADFEAALVAAGTCDDPAERLSHLRAALAAYRGDFLADLATGRWASTRRDGLRRSYEVALLEVGGALAVAGRFAEAAEIYQRAVEHDPLLEVAHRELMRCLAGAGEPGRAARRYLDLVDRLRDDLGVAPTAQTTALYRQLTGRRRQTLSAS